MKPLKKLFILMTWAVLVSFIVSSAAPVAEAKRKIKTKHKKVYLIPPPGYPENPSQPQILDPKNKGQAKKQYKTRKAKKR